MNNHKHNNKNINVKMCTAKEYREENRLHKIIELKDKATSANANRFRACARQDTELGGTVATKDVTAEATVVATAHDGKVARTGVARRVVFITMPLRAVDGTSPSRRHCRL